MRCPFRYANRIKNSTFAIDGVNYKIGANEHGGLNTLHGGFKGWGMCQVQVHTKYPLTILLDISRHSIIAIYRPPGVEVGDAEGKRGILLSRRRRWHRGLPGDRQVHRHLHIEPQWRV